MEMTESLIDAGPAEFLLSACATIPPTIKPQASILSSQSINLIPPRFLPVRPLGSSSSLTPSDYDSDTMTQPNPYILAADNPTAVLTLLRADPSIASNQDEHGYSLLHAAASYGHIDLLRALVRDFHADVNLLDEDGETCLFVTESVDIAKCLVEELGVDVARKNDEGFTALESIEADGSFPAVAAYLRQVMGLPEQPDTGADAALNPPPPLPPNIKVNLGTVSEQEANAGADEVDPEFKRRIDELAAREDFNSEATQAQLRELVMDAIRGSNINTQDREVRRRMD